MDDNSLTKSIQPLFADEHDKHIPLRLETDYKPAGDQPAAIRDLVSGVKQADRDQVLLGVTGSGKTFTMAHIISAMQKPSLILAPNKTLGITPRP